MIGSYLGFGFDTKVRLSSFPNRPLRPFSLSLLTEREPIMPLPQVYERLRTAFLYSDRIWIVQCSLLLITLVASQ